MSWISDKTGRPQEEGGHQRIDISADYKTRQVLDTVENRSIFVEYCIDSLMQPKWLGFLETKESINKDSSSFKDGAVFVVKPFFDKNQIKRINLFFNFWSQASDLEFRVSVNGNEGLKLIEHPSGKGFTYSHCYNEADMGFKAFEATLRDKDRYIFTFKFRPLNNLENCYVHNIRMFIEVCEGPILNSLPKGKSKVVGNNPKKIKT